MFTFPRLMNFLENKMVNPDLATALIGFKDNIVRDYESRYENPNGERFGIEFEEGSKYVKVVSLSWGSRSAPRAPKSHEQHRGKHPLGTFRVVMCLMQNHICLAFHGQV